MDWWTDFTHWLDKPVSNATVIVVGLVVALLFGSMIKYLGSVLEAIANGRPWPP